MRNALVHKKRLVVLQKKPLLFGIYLYKFKLQL